MKTAVILLCVLLSGTYVANAQKVSPSSIGRGIFTEEQAQRGKIAYESNCAICHGKDLISRNPDASSLTGQAFRFGWYRKTIAEQFERIRTTMPSGAAGKLSDNEYLDIVVYILRFNGYPVGEQELKLDAGILKEIVIEPRESK